MPKTAPPPRPHRAPVAPPCCMRLTRFLSGGKGAWIGKSCLIKGLPCRFSAVRVGADNRSRRRKRLIGYTQKQRQKILGGAVGAR